MTNGVAFKLNVRGLNELMKSGAMLAVVDNAAQQIAAAANSMDGGGYEVRAAHALSFDGVGRVYAATYRAKAKNRKNNTLVKATGGARV